MKQLVYIFTICMYLNTIAQTKYLTKNGEVSFEASVPTFEEVKAKNSAVTAILNTENGEFPALVLVTGFRFKNALMEEHFNENYAESNIYPKANFKGKINDFDLKTLDNNKNMFFSGTLEFHGKSKILKKTPLNVSKTLDGSLILVGVFKVNIDDFAIEIPKIVSNKISKTVDVSFNFILKKK